MLQERGRKLVGVVEVETAESVNNLEAMSQWVAFGKLRAQFHLYVPASAIDSTRRLCGDLGIPVAEIWAYHSIGDQLRFTLVQKTGPGLPKGSPEPKTSPAKVAANGSGRVTAEKPAEKALRSRRPRPRLRRSRLCRPRRRSRRPAPPPAPAPKKVAAKAKPAPAPAPPQKKAAPAPARKTAPKAANGGKVANGAKAANGKKKAAAPAVKAAKRR